MRDALDGVFDADGEVPCQIDGGLKRSGHPVGASGIRMLYEMYRNYRVARGRTLTFESQYGTIYNLGRLAITECVLCIHRLGS